MKEKDNPYVFPNGNGGHLTTFRKTFENCKKVAGIKNFRTHDTRHNFCSILASAGASLYTISKLVGHQSLAMTQRYAHLSPNTLQETSNIVSDKLGLAI